MSDPSWRVLIADDHPVFRLGLRAIVDSSHDMTVVASLLRLSLEQRFKTHRAALATVNMLRSAKLVHG